MAVIIRSSRNGLLGFFLIPPDKKMACFHDTTLIKDELTKREFKGGILMIRLSDFQRIGFSQI